MEDEKQATSTQFIYSMTEENITGHGSPAVHRGQRGRQEEHPYRSTLS